jgi:hypothetical protein
VSRVMAEFAEINVCAGPVGQGRVFAGEKCSAIYAEERVPIGGVAGVPPAFYLPAGPALRSPAFSGQLFSGLIYAASCRFKYSLWTSCGVS